MTYCQYNHPSAKPQQHSLTFGICGPANIDHMDQGIRMAQVIQELITQTPTLVSSWNKSSNV